MDKDLEFSPDNFCQCIGISIFDIYITNYPTGWERCRKCGKVIGKAKSEYISNNPF